MALVDPVADAMHHERADRLGGAARKARSNDPGRSPPRWFGGCNDGAVRLVVPLRRFFHSAIVAVSLLASERAFAYCHKSTCDPQKQTCQYDEYHCVSSGYGYVWPSLPIPYRFNAAGSKQFADDEEMRAAVRRAFRRWTQVTCDGKPTSLAFVEQADSRTSLKLGVKAPADYAIYFRDDDWLEEERDLALTRQDPFLNSGQIAAANIEVNTFDQTFRLADDQPGDFDLEAVLTHEAGHYIGLDHSPVRGSVMAPAYCDGQKPCPRPTEELRALGDDDLAAVCRLYPPTTAAPKQGCGVAAAAVDRPSVAGVGTLVFPLVVLSVRRRRGSRGRCGDCASTSGPTSPG